LNEQAVGESTRIPIRYYENNLVGTFNLLKLCDEYHCHRLVFSSSATVYGAATVMPITESTTVGNGITNAYGRTKYMIEEILHDFYQSKLLEAADSASKSSDWSIVILRYVLSAFPRMRFRPASDFAHLIVAFISWGYFFSS
jgi:UDP-glucose 4-epimerase